MEHPQELVKLEGRNVLSVAPGRQSEESSRDSLASAVLRGLPSTYNRDHQGLTPPQEVGGKQGEWKEEKVQAATTPWAFFIGPRLVNDSSQAAENGKGGEREGGGETGKEFKQLQLPAMCPHLCSVSEKEKSPPAGPHPQPERTPATV